MIMIVYCEYNKLKHIKQQQYEKKKKESGYDT